VQEEVILNPDFKTLTYVRISISDENLGLRKEKKGEGLPLEIISIWQ